MVEAMEGDVEEVFQELAMKLSTRSYNCVIQKLRCASRQTICWTIALSSTQISCRQSGGNIFYALFTDDMWAKPIGTITSKLQLNKAGTEEVGSCYSEGNGSIYILASWYIWELWSSHGCICIRHKQGSCTFGGTFIWLTTPMLLLGRTLASIKFIVSDNFCIEKLSNII